MQRRQEDWRCCCHAFRQQFSRMHLSFSSSRTNAKPSKMLFTPDVRHRQLFPPTIHLKCSKTIRNGFDVAARCHTFLALFSAHKHVLAALHGAGPSGQSLSAPGLNCSSRQLAKPAAPSRLFYTSSFRNAASSVAGKPGSANVGGEGLPCSPAKARDSADSQPFALLRYS